MQFVGINTRDLDTRQRHRPSRRTTASPTRACTTRAGKLILRFPKGSLNPQAIPSTLVLDRDGRIAARALKALSEDELRKMIDPLIAEK